MAKLTEEEIEKLHEGFETALLLKCVHKIDEARQFLGDGENWEPPEIRTDLLKLHQMAMDVINQGWTEKAQDLFDLAWDLEMQTFEIIESLEFVQKILSKLTDLYPEGLSEQI